MGQQLARLREFIWSATAIYHRYRHCSIKWNTWVHDKIINRYIFSRRILHAARESSSVAETRCIIQRRHDKSMRAHLASVQATLIAKNPALFCMGFARCRLFPSATEKRSPGTRACSWSIFSLHYRALSWNELQSELGHAARHINQWKYIYLMDIIFCDWIQNFNEFWFSGIRVS